MGGETSKEIYAGFLGELRKLLHPPERVQDGLFGAMMQVEMVNDGPVTVELEVPPPPKPQGSEHSGNEESGGAI